MKFQILGAFFGAVAANALIDPTKFDLGGMKFPDLSGFDIGSVKQEKVDAVTKPIASKPGLKSENKEVCEESLLAIWRGELEQSAGLQNDGDEYIFQLETDMNTFIQGGRLTSTRVTLNTGFESQDTVVIVGDYAYIAVDASGVLSFLFVLDKKTLNFVKVIPLRAPVVNGDPGPSCGFPLWLTVTDDAKTAYVSCDDIFIVDLVLGRVTDRLRNTEVATNPEMPRRTIRVGDSLYVIYTDGAQQRLACWDLTDNTVGSSIWIDDADPNAGFEAYDFTIIGDRAYISGGVEPSVLVADISDCDNIIPLPSEVITGLATDGGITNDDSCILSLGVDTLFVGTDKALNKITKVDTSLPEVFSISTQSRPRGCELSPNGKFFFYLDNDESFIQYDTTDLAIVGGVYFPEDARAFALNPDAFEGDDKVKKCGDRS
uniref:Uncharacterized protein n=1 Tax=Chromera velia CCMP2878 TaxID=1169474 RepID=A0A0G4GD03_9ALVE|mmetsp:Transcript_21826/g.43353  ORF Transcript_21826/g.43353 Transcript_21826/m.43353 type:complete len:431 (+) Transcript_21826:138-1430(+)|eukprot:Cvel_4517.t1-p1 / transcript=Cvel_4517.t1 / gene=Cvel_4517 / organism=Chromera_velia_CCMP2878 / gene_product=hypothetical protein / transcript_product=hypothetical protein / location=Cvel_scaffold198:4029-5813(-) / protein_length=430 / sequence_SO=supercontig / SO=protein_coding / is_pseudo=false